MAGVSDRGRCWFFTELALEAVLVAGSGTGGESRTEHSGDDGGVRGWPSRYSATAQKSGG
jgi:hypothetical protein